MVLLKASFSLLLITIITSSVVFFKVSNSGNYEEGRKCGINSEGIGSFDKCCSKYDLEKSKPEELRLEVQRSLEYNECVFRYLKYRINNYYKLASILDGDVTYKGQFPNMVAIGWTQNDETIEYNCGGSIITELFIVTAAHCSLDSGKRPNVVRIGDFDLLSDTDDEYVQQMYIADIIRHPEYSISSNYHDIALIKVDREIKMNRYVVPACIQHGPTNNNLEAGGYGTTGFGEEKSNKLMKVNLRSIDQKECKDYYHNFDEQKLGRGIVEEQFCAKSFHFNRPAMDTCNGDSGGGLQYQKRYRIGQLVYEIPILVGIVSFGITCGLGAPSVNTNVPSYIDWLESVIFP
ncbi:unnamed protein product [Diamesa tonsa]